MSQPPDDFFVPRPKLSWNVRIIRAAAFLIAVCISASCFSIELTIIRDPKTMASIVDATATLFTVALVQLTLLVPCWRTWMLQRWGC